MKNKSKLFWGSFGILVSVVAIGYLVQSFDFQKVFTDLRQVPLVYILGLPLIYMSSHLLRALRWKLMLQGQKVPVPISLKAIVLGFAGNNVLPARGGELVRMQYFSKQTQTSRVTALSSILFEKIIDGLILIGILWLSLFYNQELFQGNAMVQSVTITASLIFFAGFFFLIVLRNYKGYVIRFLKLRFGEEKPLVVKLEGLLGRIFEAVHFVRWDLTTTAVFGYSRLIWLIEGTVFILAFQAIGIEGPLVWGGLFALCILNFGILIPSSPGYIGVFQGLVVFALSVLGVDGEAPVSAAILIHASQYLPVTLAGLIIFFSESIKLTQKKAAYEN